MDKRKQLEKGNTPSSSFDQEETLKKLNELEEKLKVLQDINNQLEQLRESRKTVLENINNLYKNQFFFLKSKPEVRRVMFADDLEGKTVKEYSKKPTSLRRRSSFMAQKSQSLQNLLVNLQTWQDEVHSRRSEIESLETRKKTTLKPEEILGHEEKIRKLQMEKDELNENLLHFFLHNVSEGKDDYQGLITQLEDENLAMEDRIYILQDKISFLKNNNKALMLENQYLRQGKTTETMEDQERRYRKSFLAQKSSTLLPESHIIETSSDDMEPRLSAQSILEMENEDKLSLDKQSVDSFSLDKQLANWKMDSESLTCNMKRLEEECKEMEVLHMKLNFLKRYVRKHGVKYINRDTLIDPSLQGLHLWGS